MAHTDNKQVVKVEDTRSYKSGKALRNIILLAAVIVIVLVVVSAIANIGQKTTPNTPQVVMPQAAAPAVVSANNQAAAVSGSCVAVRNGDVDSMSSVSATGATLTIEAWGSINGIIVVPNGETISKPGMKGALWSYGCTDTQAVLNNEAANHSDKSLYVVTGGQPVLTSAATFQSEAVGTAVPSDGATVVPTAVVNNIVVQGTANCHADEIARSMENSSGDRNRMEIGGSGVQHLDFYPAHGIKSVSYILPKMPAQETPIILWGFGSQFEYNKEVDSCKSEEILTQVVKYTQDRLDSGHSGKYVDLRDKSWSEAKAYFASFGFDQAGVFPTPEASSSNPQAQVATGECSAKNIGPSDKLTTVTAGTSILVVETYGGTPDQAYVIVPPGQSVNKTWTTGAIWDYQCNNDNLTIVKADVLTHKKPIYLVVNKTLTSFQ